MMADQLMRASQRRKLTCDLCFEKFFALQRQASGYWYCATCSRWKWHHDFINEKKHMTDEETLALEALVLSRKYVGEEVIKELERDRDHWIHSLIERHFSIGRQIVIYRWDSWESTCEIVGFSSADLTRRLFRVTQGCNFHEAIGIIMCCLHGADIPNHPQFFEEIPREK